MKIDPLGDSAVVIHVADDAKAQGEETLEKVLWISNVLKAQAIKGVVDVVPAFNTIGVLYDPAVIVTGGVDSDGIFQWLCEQIKGTLAAAREHGGLVARAVRPIVDIPVCYDAEFALDLPDIAQRAGLLQSKVVHLHCAAEYRVQCVGFTPGFPFLTGLATELTTPRRSSPRTEVPAGSVAIGGTQTGIYPQKSPGGWNVIGRTPLRLFDITREQPSLLAAGDRVRFRQISCKEFDDEASHDATR